MVFKAIELVQPSITHHRQAADLPKVVSEALQST